MRWTSQSNSAVRSWSSGGYPPPQKQTAHFQGLRWIVRVRRQRPGHGCWMIQIDIARWIVPFHRLFSDVIKLTAKFIIPSHCIRRHGNPDRVGENVDNIVMLSGIQLFECHLYSLLRHDDSSLNWCHACFPMYAPVRFQDLPFFDLPSMYHQVRSFSGRNGNEFFWCFVTCCSLIWHCNSSSREKLHIVPRHKNMGQLQPGVKWIWPGWCRISHMYVGLFIRELWIACIIALANDSCSSSCCRVTRTIITYDATIRNCPTSDNGESLINNYLQFDILRSH